MVPQTTANLWEALCQDLQEQRKSLSTDHHRSAVMGFVGAARQVLRPGSQRLCDAIEIAGDVCAASGSDTDAEKSYLEAYALSQKLTPPQSAARLCAKLAMLYDRMNHAEKAGEFYRRAISLYESTHDHAHHTWLLNNLAALLKKAGDLEGAEKEYQRAITHAIDVHGPEHPEVALIANNLGVLFTERGDYTKAENLHMRALSIREKTFGASHPEVAESMANLAVVYHAAGDEKKADNFYRGAAEILLRHHGENDQRVQRIRQNQARLFQKQN